MEQIGSGGRATKEEFRGTVARIRGALAHIEAVYPPMIASVQPFDRELAARLEACRAADRALYEHLSTKAEAPAGLVGRVVTMLLGR